MSDLRFMSPYLKGGGDSARRANRIRYFATRPGVEVLSDGGSQPATKKQKAYIQRLLQAFPDARELLEYEDYLKNQTQESASEFIRQAREDFAVPMSQRENYLDYVSHRPGVELRGEHGLWTSGGNTVVFLATLQDVPRELLEAARVDGANAFWQFRAVTFQTIKPVLFFQMIMCMVTSIQIFTQSVALSSNGGPDRMTYFINVMIYQHSFKDLGLRGLASAEAWIVFLVTMVIALVMFTIGGTFKKDDGTARKGRKKH